MSHIAMLIVAVMKLSACATDIVATLPALAGSDVALDDAISRSDLIFQGTVSQVQPPAPTAPGQAVYPCVVIPAGNAWMGQINDNKMIVMVKARNTGEIREEPPEANRSYIFFVLVHDKHVSAVKLLPSDEKTVADVRDRIGKGKK